MIRILTALLLLAQVSFAQGDKAVPQKLQTLKANYEAAVLRATTPLTKSYLQELQRLKLEYTRAGDLSAALAADALIQAASASSGTPPVVAAGDAALANVSVEQFKAWLATVVITETAGFKNSFTYDGKELTSTKDGALPRGHQNVTISVGKIFIPFTNTNATIEINSTRSKAEVTYSTGQKLEAKIEPKSALKAR